MPLHEVGYRSWTEQRTAQVTRWWVLAAVSILLVWRATWLKRTILLMWLPAILMAFGFLAFEQSIVQPELRKGLAFFLQNFAQDNIIVEQYAQSPEAARRGVWSTLLLTFFRYPQLLAMVLVVGMIAPRQIAYDVRTRAYLLLFSRPITAFEYVLGKQTVVWFYLAMITTVPALILYLLGVLLSPDLGVLRQTWDLPLRVMAASLLLILPTSAVALAYSSLATDSRFAGFAWYATWALGWSAYTVLTLATLGPEGLRGRSRLQPAVLERWEFVSPYHILGRVQQWCFGLLPAELSVTWYLVALLVVTCVSWLIVQSRIQRVSRA